MNLLVVGAGEMGRWVADTVAADVTFVDRDRAVAVDAAERRGASLADADTDERFDAVCLAVPMGIVDDAIERYASNATGAIFDVSGAMAGPIESMADHAPGCERASFHPLFAPPRVPGNVAVVTDADGPLLRTVREAMTAAGNTVFETTVAEHDTAMETVQAGAHAAILAYALAAADVREEFATPVSAGLDRLVRTVTEGSPHVYADIQAVFGDGADAVAAAAAEIAESDAESFESLYRTAGAQTNSRTRHE
ncbi:prephenate dehydrogenase [Haloferacaceae archaeon DSL9]